MEVLGKRRRAAEARREGALREASGVAHVFQGGSVAAADTPSGSELLQPNELLQPSMFLLTRTALCISIQPECSTDAAASPAGASGGKDLPDAELWQSIARAAQTITWPQRELRWAPGPPVLLPSPPRIVLRCSLLALDGGDDPAAEAHLLRRVTAATAAACPLRGPTSPRVLLATRTPVPLHQATLRALEAPGAAIPAVLRAVAAFGLAVVPPEQEPRQQQAEGGGEPLPLVSADHLRRLRLLAAARVREVEAAVRADDLVPFRDDFAYAEASSRSRGRIEIRLGLSGDSIRGDRAERSARVQEGDGASGASAGAAGIGDAADPALIGQLALRSPWATAARALLRDPFPWVTASLIVSRPGAAAQPWHSDGPHLAPSAPNAQALARADPVAAEWGAAGVLDPPHAVCAFIPLVVVSERLGGTEFWVGSHARCASSWVVTQHCLPPRACRNHLS